MGFIYSIEIYEISHQIFGSSHRKCPTCPTIFVNTVPILDLQYWGMMTHPADTSTLIINPVRKLNCHGIHWWIAALSDIGTLSAFLKGHLHQGGKRVGRPRGSRPRVPQCIGLKELCGAVYTAAGPLRLRGGRPKRSLMERFFCGTRRNRERWLVGIYRSKIQCREMGLQQSEIVRGPALV